MLSGLKQAIKRGLEHQQANEFEATNREVEEPPSQGFRSWVEGKSESQCAKFVGDWPIYDEGSFTNITWDFSCTDRAWQTARVGWEEGSTGMWWIIVLDRYHPKNVSFPFIPFITNRERIEKLNPEKNGNWHFRLIAAYYRSMLRTDLTERSVATMTPRWPFWS